MSRQFEEALAEALDLLEQGTPIVKILSRYPELDDELRPYLVTALHLNQLAKSSSPTAQEKSKSDFLGYAEAMQTNQRKSAAAWMRQILVSSLAVLLILFFAGAVMAVSSSEAIPGDALYDTKLFLEQIRLNYSANSEAAAALIEALHQERLDEVNTLLTLGREEIVTFSGIVEELEEGRWIIEGIPVAITPSTIIHDKVEFGFLVQVMGKTSSNIVLAEQVEVLAEQPPDFDLTDPSPQEEPSVLPLPKIEPLEIPERPELLLPDVGSVSPTPPLEPVSTIIHEDDSTGGEGAGYEDEGDRLETQPREDDDAQQERENGAGESSSIEQDDSDERDDEEDQNDSSDDGSENHEEEKAEPGSEREDDEDEKNEKEEIEGDKTDDVNEG